MIRLLIFFVIVTLMSLGFAWFADRPGNLIIRWQGYEIETSLFMALVMVGLLTAFLLALWSLIRNLIASPATISGYFKQRKQSKGMEAVSSGMIAIGAGDRSLAQRFSAQAKRTLPNEPLTDLLRAQSAQINGDRSTARRIYESMLSSPETELLGLRGLFLEAKQENELEPARQFAERALRLNPSLEWSANALFDLQCRMGNWSEALETLAIAKKHGHVDKKLSDRRRAVLLTAQAGECEDGDMDAALVFALEAHRLAPDLVPAADIAGRILASQGQTSKAAKIIQKTWKLSPHPDLARTYAFARPGDSANDRLSRVKELATRTPNSLESPIAIADAAIEAHDWASARNALEPLLDKRLTARICILMAHIEGGQFGDKGRVREWLARAVHAPRDPAWTADGYISEHWSPISPITGELDSFDWQVPVDSLEEKDSNRLLEKLNVLAADALLEAAPSGATAAVGAASAAKVASAASAAIETGDAGTDTIKLETLNATSLKSEPISAEADKPEPVITETAPDEKRDEAEKTSSKSSDSSIEIDGANVDQADIDKALSRAKPGGAVIADEKPAKQASAAASASASARPPATGSDKKTLSKEASRKAAEKAQARSANNDEISDKLPGRLRSLPPPSPEIAPSSEPRIFISPRAPDDPGPD